MDNDDNDSTQYVAARYIGHTAVRLLPRRGGYRDGNGQRRTGRHALMLSYGDTLMLPAQELYGETRLIDPTGVVNDVRSLGVGVVLLEQHAGLTRDDVLGVRFRVDGQLRMYEFHDGRTDFEPLVASTDASTDASAADASAADASALSSDSSSSRASSKKSSSSDKSSASSASAADTSAAQGE